MTDKDYTCEDWGTQSEWTQIKVKVKLERLDEAVAIMNMVSNYLQIEDYGWDGVAKCCGINYATGFTSAIYDFSFNWTIDQSMYDDYSYTYLMDEADFWENYQN